MWLEKLQLLHSSKFWIIRKNNNTREASIESYLIFQSASSILKKGKGRASIAEYYYYYENSSTRCPLVRVAFIWPMSVNPLRAIPISLFFHI